MGPTLQVGAAGAAAGGVSAAAGVGGVAGAVAGTGAGAGVVGVWALASDAIVMTIPVPHCNARYDFKFFKGSPPKNRDVWMSRCVSRLRSRQNPHRVHALTAIAGVSAAHWQIEAQDFPWELRMNFARPSFRDRLHRIEFRVARET